MATGRTNKQGGASVSLTGDAVIAEVLNSKTFYNTDPNTKLTGTMPNKVGSATVITPSTSDQTIPQGYYGGASGDGKVIGDADLISANIKSGANIFGVSGNSNVVDTSSGDAVAGEILSNKKAWVSGAEITGSMANNGALGTYTPTTSNQSIPAGYTSGGTVAGDADLIAGNIKSGVNLFGVTGNYNGSIYGSGGAVQNIIPNFTDRNPISIAGSEDGRYVYIISKNGVTYYLDVSSDGGRTWTNKYASTIAWGSNNSQRGIICSTNGQYVLVFGANNSGTVYRSADYGANFSSISLGSSTQSWDACMNEGGDCMYVNGFESSVGKLFKSTNYGASFAATATNIGQCNAIDCSSNGLIVFAARSGSSQVWKSTDGGETFPITNLGYSATNLALCCNAAGDTFVAAYGPSGGYYKNVSGSTTNIGFANNAYFPLAASRDLSVIIGTDTLAYLSSLYRAGSFDLSGNARQQLFPLNASKWTIKGGSCRSNNSVYFVAEQASSNQIMLCRYIKQ